jgi:hypothetical protein
MTTSFEECLANPDPVAAGPEQTTGAKRFPAKDIS